MWNFKKIIKSVTFGNYTTVLYIKVLSIELIFKKSLPLALISHRHFFFFFYVHVEVKYFNTSSNT